MCAKSIYLSVVLLARIIFVTHETFFMRRHFLSWGGILYLNYDRTRDGNCWKCLVALPVFNTSIPTEEHAYWCWLLTWQGQFHSLTTYESSTFHYFSTFIPSLNCLLFMSMQCKIVSFFNISFSSWHLDPFINISSLIFLLLRFHLTCFLFSNSMNS